jgi:hypothetical protein
MDKYTQELLNGYVRQINHKKMEVNSLKNQVGMRNGIILFLSLALVVSMVI